MTPTSHQAAAPIQIPAEWADTGLLTFEEFCDLIRIPQRTVRDWRRRGVGPRWARLEGTGRLYLTVAEARRFLSSATTTTAPAARSSIRPDNQASEMVS